MIVKNDPGAVVHPPEQCDCEVKVKTDQTGTGKDSKMTWNKVVTLGNYTVEEALRERRKLVNGQKVRVTGGYRLVEGIDHTYQYLGDRAA